MMPAPVAPVLTMALELAVAAVADGGSTDANDDHDDDDDDDGEGDGDDDDDGVFDDGADVMMMGSSMKTSKSLRGRGLSRPEMMQVPPCPLRRDKCVAPMPWQLKVALSHCCRPR